jgi:BCCT family betaine/carnitine transporter
MNAEKRVEKLKLYKPLFITSTVLVTAVSALIIIFPQASGAVINGLNALATGPMGWWYLLAILIIFGIVMFLTFSSYGNIKLGGEHTRPDFSNFAWIGMIVSCGTGSSLLYYGTIEWAFYYNTAVTPWSVPPGTWRAAEMSFTYALFHEGITAWALYAACAMIIGYYYHVKKLPFLRLSSICGEVLGKHIDGPLGKGIDLLFIFGILGGVSTSIGISTRTIAQMVSSFLGLETNFTLELVIVMVRTSIIAVAVGLGLEKGIKRIAALNMWALYGFLALVFIAGPTWFILNNFSSAIGQVLTNFFSFSLWTDAVGGSRVPQDWTIFYWAWWLLYAPVTGLFLAKISRGRTFREIGVAVMGGGTIAIWVMYAIMTGFAMDLEFSGAVPVSEIANSVSGEAAVVEILRALPAGTVMVLIYGIVMFIYSLGTLNSFAYTLAASTTVSLKQNQDPMRWNRVFWAVFLNVFAVGLMFLGGMKTLQIASIVTAFPLLFIVLIMIANFFRSLKKDGINQRKAIIINETYTGYRPRMELERGGGDKNE